MTNHRFPIAGGLLALAFSTFALVALPGAASAQSLGPCSSFYPGGYTVPEGKMAPAQAAMSKPAKGAVFKEPNFGTCMVRATDHAKEGLPTFARNDYSRRQAFNADTTYFIVYAKDGWWHLYDARTLAHIRALGPSSGQRMAADAEPQWHPTDPNALYYVPTNGGTKLLKLDVRNNSYTVAADFAGKLPSWGSAARHIWTKSEGSPSADGRYWGFQVEDGDFRLLGYMVWDLQQNRLAGSMQSGSRPDHSSMSAAGRWFVTSSDTTGTWAWSRDFKTKKKLHHKSEHSDLALGPNGEDYYVSLDYQSNNGDVFFTDIDACPGVPASATDAPTCPRTVLFQLWQGGGGTALHVSGKGMKKPGWAVISTYASKRLDNGNWPWYANKVFAIELKANPRTYPLAYTRNGGGPYWAEPQASVSRDFTRIIFNSNWGVNGDDIDAYTVHIPATALPGGTSSPPSFPPMTTGGVLPPLVSPGDNAGASVETAGATTSATPVPAGDGDSTSATVGGNRIAITPPALAFLRQSLSFMRSMRTNRLAPRRSAAALAPLLVTPGIGWPMQFTWIGLSKLDPGVESQRRATR